MPLGHGVHYQSKPNACGTFLGQTNMDSPALIPPIHRTALGAKTEAPVREPAPTLLVSVNFQRWDSRQPRP
jgi:hypothetical protein